MIILAASHITKIDGQPSNPGVQYKQTVVSIVVNLNTRSSFTTRFYLYEYIRTLHRIRFMTFMALSSHGELPTPRFLFPSETQQTVSQSDQ